jgi:ascorbate-specific PTS system EIIC-type component UlaA
VDVLEFIAVNLFNEVSILIGAITAIGLLLQRKPVEDVVGGAIRATIGIIIRRYGLSEVDATRALLFFRNALIESVMKVYREANIHSGKAWEEMLHKMHTFTDLILLSLLETYHKLESVNH